MSNGLHLGIFFLPMVTFMLHGCIDLNGLKDLVDNVTATMLPCPSWVGTNASGLCLTVDPNMQIGACYNASNGMAQVTCIEAFSSQTGERLNLTGYYNHQCGMGSKDKCLFNSSFKTLLNTSANSSATVQAKFEARPNVFRGMNLKLTSLGFMVGLASLAGGAAVIMLRRVKTYPEDLVKTYPEDFEQTVSLIEEPGDVLEE